MGLILIGVLTAGGFLGVIVSIVSGSTGVWLATRSAKLRKYVWPGFTVVYFLFLCLLIAGISFYPFDTVEPGSDYDMAMKNFFFKGLFYCASIGLASLPAGVFSMMMPKVKAHIP
ncbi:MAG: hypothetical protein D3926_01585 [Desulfobacteraceae bacterium]|nr:MAG: hypothetical protein D3926_01585 [Desulfobacteraceae bacterium]